MNIKMIMRKHVYYMDLDYSQMCQTKTFSTLLFEDMSGKCAFFFLLGWGGYLTAYQLFMDYLMPKFDSFVNDHVFNVAFHFFKSIVIFLYAVVISSVPI